MTAGSIMWEHRTGVTCKLMNIIWCAGQLALIATAAGGTGLLADSVLSENTGIALGMAIAAVTGAFMVGLRVATTVTKIHDKLEMLEKHVAKLPCQIKPSQCADSDE